MHPLGNSACCAVRRGVGRRRPLHAAVIVAIVLAHAGPAAAADPKLECIEANTRGQDLRREGKFVAAREQLTRCAEPDCPAIVRDDCTRRLDEVDRVQPRIVFGVSDASGADLIEVRVSVDGRVLAQRLDGTAFKVDPGAHEFRFEAPGQPAVTRRLLVKEGDTERRETVVIGAAQAPPAAQAAPASSAAPTAPESEVPPAPRGLGTRKIVGLAVAGGGGVALGVGAAFGLLASSAWSRTKSDCGGDPNRCSNISAATPDHDTTKTDATVSTAAFVVGGVLVAAGVAIFFTGGGGGDRAPAPVSLTPFVERGAAGAGVGGTF